MKRAEKRQHLVDVATRVFNEHGYHGAGIDMVIAEAGIAKTTLYRHFASKEELIVAVLSQFDERFRARMRETVDRLSLDTEGKLLATFDFLKSWFAEKSFFGCPFMGAAGEFADRGHPVFRQVATHKRLMLAYFEELAHAAKLADPRTVAEQINLLHEGATAVAHVTGTTESADQARAAASVILQRIPIADA